MCFKENNKIIYIIKLKKAVSNLDDFRLHLKNSYQDNMPPAYYNLTNKTSNEDKKIFEQMNDSTNYHCAILDYTGDEITRLYWTICFKHSDNINDSIHCSLKYETECKALIENFVYCLQLNLEKDFAKNSFINFDISNSLIEQMRKFEMSPYYVETKDLVYKKLTKEEKLSKLAQKNEYCQRKYNFREPQKRGEFQRDYDRIMYSKAFRRLVDKAQIFSSTKGDYYRTRMTHTLVVCQIARSICLQLDLNCNLAEAIAIGHDLGHTPFGHQGERTLNYILKGQKGYEVENLSLVSDGKKFNQLFPYGGFKHNYQSVRVCTNLESQYAELDGLDLSEQTLNGIWMHTNKKDGMSISSFSDGYLTDEGDYPFTLEGQVVAVADEIAQCSHDIDDAISAHLIAISDFSEYLELKKYTRLKKEIKSISEQLDNLKEKNRLLVDKDEIICSQISSVIVAHFIKDVCEYSNGKIKGYNEEEFERNGHKIHERIIWFSDSGYDLCSYLKNIIGKKVINSNEVNLFDQKGSNIILSLFRAYYKNPMLLHTGTLKRIWNECRKHDLEMIDFVEGKPELIKEEWKNITDACILADISKQTNRQKDLLQKREILVRNICDFISGMTDSYAINEFNRIYS